MHLREINLKMILREYQTYEKFTQELDLISKTLPYDERHRLDNIIIYFNNLFELKLPLAPDVLRLQDMVLDNLLFFMSIQETVNRKSLQLLIELMSFNLQYVVGVKSLTGS